MLRINPEPLSVAFPQTRLETYYCFLAYYLECQFLQKLACSFDRLAKVHSKPNLVASKRLLEQICLKAEQLSHPLVTQSYLDLAMRIYDYILSQDTRDSKALLLFLRTTQAFKRFDLAKKAVSLASESSYLNEEAIDLYMLFAKDAHQLDEVRSVFERYQKFSNIGCNDRSDDYRQRLSYHYMQIMGANHVQDPKTLSICYNWFPNTCDCEWLKNAYITASKASSSSKHIDFSDANKYLTPAHQRTQSH